MSRPALTSAYWSIGVYSMLVLSCPPFYTHPACTSIQVVIMWFALGIVSVVITQMLLLFACGAMGIATTDSIRSMIGAFFMGSIFSMVLSTVANFLLITLPEASGSPTDLLVIMVKTLLAAFAQPTVSGVVLLSLLCFLAMAAAKLGAMVEDINVLLATHKVVIDDKANIAAADNKKKH
eukprot:gene8133-5668_t